MTQSPDYAFPPSPWPPALAWPFLENLIRALGDDNAGPTEPPNAFPFMRWRDTSVTPSVLRVRNATNTGWIPLLTDLGPVGTVAQVGGVPTGAIIETGSNANGRYVRLADGTQFCIRSGFTMTTTVANTFASATWTFPIAFSANPDVGAWIGSPVSNQLMTAAAAPASASAATIRLATSSTLSNQPMTLFAKGRWF